MALTKITADVLKDSTIVVADLAATGTPTSSTALQGNDVWATLSTSGALNIAAADPGTGETSGNTWYLSGIVNFVTDSVGIAGTWTSGGVLNYARDYPALSGTQRAGLIVSDEGSANRQKCEEYDGSTWTNANPAVLQLWYTTMFGSQSASVECTGNNPVATSNNANEYDGTCWAASADIGTPRRAVGSSGTLSAGLTFSGYLQNTNNSNVTEEYDGTSWAAGGNITTACHAVRGAGTQTATVMFGGMISAAIATTEEYNGTAWSASNNMLTARRHCIGFGQMTAAVAAGGQTTSPAANIALTEYYDGTCWAIRNNLLQNIATTHGAGSNNAGFTAGGYDNAALSATEEWTAPVVQFVVV